MNWVDFVILAIIALSALVAYFRGFFREAIGLATWVLAFWIAFQVAEPAESLLSGWIDARSIRLAIAFGVVFIVILILGAIANYFIGKLVSSTGFAGTDRVLGAVFGGLRGIAVLVLVVLFAGVTPIPQDDWWSESTLLDHLERGALWVSDWMPPGFAEEVHYNGPQSVKILHTPESSNGADQGHV